MKKFALVLSGGGFKGAFQVGALKYLKENWYKLNPSNQDMKFDIVAGVSVGSLNGLLVASNKFDKLEELWKDISKKGVEEIYTSDFIDTKADSDTVKLKINFDKIRKKLIPNVTFSLWQRIKLLFKFLFSEKQALIELKAKVENDLEVNLKKFTSLADNSPLKNKLAELAHIEDIKDCIFKCGYVSLKDGAYYSFKHTDFKSDEDFINGILASTVMPIVWPPVKEINTIFEKENQQVYSVDGGVRNVSPLGDVIKEISDAVSDDYMIIIINCSSGMIEDEDFEERNIAQIALRTLVDITISEIFNNDIKEFVDKNFIVKQFKAELPSKEIYDYDYSNKKKGKPLRTFNSIIIQPNDLILGDSLVANQVLIEKRLNHGKEKAADAIEQYLKPKGFETTIS